MIEQSAQDVERKVMAILKVLTDTSEPVGATVIARQLKNLGVDLTERGVRYHLKLMDERGFTERRGRDGRLITEQGREELQSALVTDKIGFIIAKIQLLAYRTTFDPLTRRGEVVVNVSFFPKERFPDAVKAMSPAFRAGLGVSDLVVVGGEGERLGESIVPRGKMGIGTVCSVTTNGVLLKSGIPMDSNVGGILQLRNSKPLRFVEIIRYSGSTLDPSEVFLRGKMTSVQQAATEGRGRILANFREIPAVCRDLAVGVLARLHEVGLGGLVIMGNTSEPLCEIPVGLNRVGLILLGGLNPVAAAMEAGIDVENAAMGGMVEFSRLRSFWDL
jgi:repressor of nif and glnA expression